MQAEATILLYVKSKTNSAEIKLDFKNLKLDFSAVKLRFNFLKSSFIFSVLNSLVFKP